MLSARRVFSLDTSAGPFFLERTIQEGRACSVLAELDLEPSSGREGRMSEGECSPDDNEDGAETHVQWLWQR